MSCKLEHPNPRGGRTHTHTHTLSDGVTDNYRTRRSDRGRQIRFCIRPPPGLVSDQITPVPPPVIHVAGAGFRSDPTKYRHRPGAIAFTGIISAGISPSARTQSHTHTWYYHRREVSFSMNTHIHLVLSPQENLPQYQHTHTHTADNPDVSLSHARTASCIPGADKGFSETVEEKPLGSRHPDSGGDAGQQHGRSPPPPPGSLGGFHWGVLNSLDLVGPSSSERWFSVVCLVLLQTQLWWWLEELV